MDAGKQELQENPLEGAGLLSIWLFAWTIPLFKKGYRKVLELEDMFRPLSVDRSNLLGDRLDE